MGNTNEFHIICAGTAGLDMTNRQFFTFIGISYECKNAPQGCTARGEEESCFATPLARLSLRGALTLF